MMGARRLVGFLGRNLSPVYKKLGLVVVVDVTSSNYPLPMSVEHRFFEKEPLRNKLKFRRKRDFEDFLKYCLEGDLEYGWEEDAEVDESSAYAEFDLNVVSLCLPVRVEKSLHSREGGEVELSSVVKYGEGLWRVVRRAVDFSLRVKK
jgi:hypothetical protein